MEIKTSTTDGDAAQAHNRVRKIVGYFIALLIITFAAFGAHSYASDGNFEMKSLKNLANQANDFIAKSFKKPDDSANQAPMRHSVKDIIQKMKKLNMDQNKEKKATAEKKGNSALNRISANSGAKAQAKLKRKQAMAKRAAKRKAMLEKRKAKMAGKAAAKAKAMAVKAKATAMAVKAKVMAAKAKAKAKAMAARANAKAMAARERAKAAAGAKDNRESMKEKIQKHLANAKAKAKDVANEMDQSNQKQKELQHRIKMNAKIMADKAKAAAQEVGKRNNFKLAEKEKIMNAQASAFMAKAKAKMKIKAQTAEARAIANARMRMAQNRQRGQKGIGAQTNAEQRPNVSLRNSHQAMRFGRMKPDARQPLSKTVGHDGALRKPGQGAEQRQRQREGNQAEKGRGAPPPLLKPVGHGAVHKPGKGPGQYQHQPERKHGEKGRGAPPPLSKRVGHGALRKPEKGAGQHQSEGKQGEKGRGAPPPLLKRVGNRDVVRKPEKGAAQRKPEGKLKVLAEMQKKRLHQKQEEEELKNKLVKLEANKAAKKAQEMKQRENPWKPKQN